VISLALAAVKTSEAEQLAASGYRFYAEEASEFAAASRRAVAEAWTGGYAAGDREGLEQDGQAR
jgi:hypothetical protein